MEGVVAQSRTIHLFPLPLKNYNKYRLKLKLAHIFRNFIFVLLFLIGGTLQYFSIISITKTNLLVVVLMIFCLLNKYSFRKIIYLSSSLWPLVLYLLFICIVASYHGSSLEVFFAYSLSAIFPLVVLVYTRGVICNSHDAELLVIRFFYAILVVQVPVLILQSFYADNILLMQSLNVDIIDLRFGTFFLKSDATVGLFANILLMYILSRETVQLKKMLIVVYLLTILSIIIIVNSLLSKVVFVFILLMYFVKKYISLNKNLFACIFFLFLIFVILIGVQIDFTKYYVIANHEKMAILSDIYRYDHSSVPRYSVILLLFNKVPLLGNGLFDYYNYLTKEWKFFAGHSLWLSIYNDTGPIGVLLIILFYWKIFVTSARDKLFGFVLFALSISYSITSFLLYDVGALLILAFFSCVNTSERPTRSV